MRDFERATRVRALPSFEGAQRSFFASLEETLRGTGRSELRSTPNVRFPLGLLPLAGLDPDHDLRQGGFLVMGAGDMDEEMEVDPVIEVGIMPSDPIPPRDSSWIVTSQYLLLLRPSELPIPGPGVTLPNMITLLRCLVLLRNFLMDPMHHSLGHFERTGLAAWLNASLQIVAALAPLVDDAEEAIRTGRRMELCLSRFMASVWPHLSQFLPERQTPPPRQRVAPRPIRRRARSPDSDL